MNKENLEKLKENILLLDAARVNLLEKREEFEEENAELIGRIGELRHKVDHYKDVARENAEAGFKKDGEKKRLGGIGIREKIKFTYEEEEAITWCDEKMPIAIERKLNKKFFEQWLKDGNGVDFVEETHIIQVTFPKEIKLED